MSRRYVLISPCRDEAAYVRRTLDSVAAQTCPPALWVVVDDGSNDETPAILEEYTKRLSYLRVVRREDRGARAVGPGVIEAFYAGLDTIDLDEFDYVCKCDVDLDLPPRYFERLMEMMEANPRLGTCSGKPYYPHPKTGALVSEHCGDETSVGMTKFYRVECFRRIGGFVREVMWDGIDCHRCRQLGWNAMSVDEPDIRFMHLRAMGSSQKGIWTGRKRHGYGQWFMGTGPLYMLASSAFRATKHPYVIGGLGMMWGYLEAWARGARRYDDIQFRRSLRAYQRECMIRGKSAATRRLDESGVRGRVGDVNQRRTAA